ncbi:hypothetical protein ACFVVX_24465 [Kitasatospora sp. NPDC058170]|uniref:hypothetical protein n=1 Tax=Kitasatospora sp. NPDC058170 TaxID=3346364 RepID=UPI0036DF040D
MRAENHSVAIGHADQVSYFTGRRAPASFPYQVGALPNAAHCFQRRALPDAPAGCRILLGTAGVGKTQLAVHEARTAWQQGRLDLLVWVAADSRAAILAAYARTMAELNGTEPGDPEPGARDFLAWLRPGGAGRAVRWMVVLDGLVDPDDLRGLWPPDRPQGRTLITSWRRDVAREDQGRHLVTVPVFSSAEAHDYLTAVLATADRAEQPEQLAALARELGHLPLALAQAARYLGRTGLSCADYLDRLRDGGHRLADLVPDPGGLPDEQGEPLPQIWDRALRQVDPTARLLLELLAPLDPAGVPGAVVNRLLGQALAQPGEQAQEVGSGGVLDLLHRWSLADHDPSSEQRTVRVHPLVQRAVYESAPADRSDRLVDLAVDALLAGTVMPPRPMRDPAYDAYYEAVLSAEDAAFLGLGRADGPQLPAVRAETLRGNVEALLRRPYRRQPGFRAALLARRVGELLVTEGKPEQAVAYFRSLLAETVEESGEDSSAAREIRAALAEACATGGDLTSAVTAYRALIDDRMRRLAAQQPGPSSYWPVKLVEEASELRRRLAHWLEQGDDPAAVAAVYRDLVNDENYLRASPGFGGFRDYALRAEAADWQGRAGDAAGAALAYRYIVDERLGRYGPQHEDTFAARYGFARWLGESGDLRTAVRVLTDLLRDQLQVLWHNYRQPHGPAGAPRDPMLWRGPQAPDHLGTFRTRAALAFWLGRSGDARAAVAALTELLNEQLRYLGPAHPEVVTTRQNLAYWQQQPKRKGRRR